MMINMRCASKYNKKQILEIARNGEFINTDGIRSDLDARGMAVYLQRIGFNIKSYEDKGTHGLVTTSEGVLVSSNGYCYMGK
ncbi:hypothetical protein [Clostridium estertheticum]|uniref:hypothetical protein n=1 Tax=Clostridium estertheticum TaxID=238834 RepID=UPI001C0E22DA|nr:hypothetical protein [Clostridium estertheticum]MBU3173401.1 hypothetical protein [Clostridium estertheticum]